MGATGPKDRTAPRPGAARAIPACAAAVAAAAVLAYLNSLHGAFQLDDYKVVLSDPAALSWSGWLDDLGRGIRPLLKLSYVLTWSTGLGLPGFHLVNVLIHAGASVLVLLIARRLLETPAAEAPGWETPAALFAAFLFALHPIQTEAVTYVSGRSSSLMALLYLASMAAYIEGRLEGRPLFTRALSPALFLLALAVKETAATLPAALLLWERTRRDRTVPLREAIRSQAVHWAVAALGLAAFVTTPGHRFLLAYSYGLRSVCDNVLSQIHGQIALHGHYLLPGRLTFDPDLPVVNGWSWRLVLEAAALAAALAAGLRNLRRRPLVAFAVLWVFLHSVAVYAAVPRTDILNERHLYLGGFGLALLAGAGAAWLARVRPGLRTVVAALACAVLLALGLCTADRNTVYRSEVSLWEDTAAKSPGKARVFNNLGYAYFLAGRSADARKAWLEALRIDPDHELARNNLTLLDIRGDVL